MVSSGLSHHVALVRSVRRLLVAACVVPSSPIFVTLMKEEPGSSGQHHERLHYDMLHSSLDFGQLMYWSEFLLRQVHFLSGTLN
jgi:hypothetical protein